MPDCSHTSLCSDCGVCGDDFGKNVVVQPPEIPTPAGRYNPATSPFTATVQRLQMVFSRQGDSTYCGHLGFCRLLEKSLKRGGIPVANTMS